MLGNVEPSTQEVLGRQILEGLDLPDGTDHVLFIYIAHRTSTSALKQEKPKGRLPTFPLDLVNCRSMTCIFVQHLMLYSPCN